MEYEHGTHFHEFPGNFPGKPENHGFSREISRVEHILQRVISDYIVPVNQNLTRLTILQTGGWVRGVTDGRGGGRWSK